MHRQGSLVSVAFRIAPGPGRLLCIHGTRAPWSLDFVHMQITLYVCTCLCSCVVYARLVPACAAVWYMPGIELRHLDLVTSAFTHWSCFSQQCLSKVRNFKCVLWGSKNSPSFEVPRIFFYAIFWDICSFMFILIYLNIFYFSIWYYYIPYYYMVLRFLKKNSP